MSVAKSIFIAEVCTVAVNLVVVISLVKYVLLCRSYYSQGPLHLLIHLAEYEHTAD